MMPIEESRFTYRGYNCVVLFMPGCYRCGYVGLPNTSKFYRKKYDFIPIECHGGLTYSENFLITQPVSDLWWIGFDCGHCWDGYDVDMAMAYFEDDEEWKKFYSIMGEFWRMSSEEIKTNNYVIQELKDVVNQIIELEKGEKVY